MGQGTRILGSRLKVAMMQAPVKFAKLFPAVFLAAVFLACSAPARAQVSPQEILNPRAKALEKEYLPRLISFNHAIQSLRFPFPFAVRRYVGLSGKQDPAPDTRGLQFLHYQHQVILKISGDYQAAYNAAVLNRNQRAARAFETVVVPILRILPREMPASVPCDGVGIEISYHVHNGGGGFDFEGAEDMVALFSKADAFGFAKLSDKAAWQEVLNRSRVYVDKEQIGLALNQSDPIPLEALDDSSPQNSGPAPVAEAAPPPPAAAPPAQAAPVEASSPGTSDRLANLDRELGLRPVTLPQKIQRPASGAAPAASPAPVAPAAAAQSEPAPSATQADVARLQGRYQAQLDELAKQGATEMHLVSYAPPAFVLFQNRVYLQVTLRNPQVFNAQTTSIYKRAARSFDLFLAPQLKSLLARVPSDPSLAGLDITVLNELGPKPGGSSEAAEFVCPLAGLRQFVNAEVTNQDLINQSIVLVNGVRIALNLQQVE